MANRKIDNSIAERVKKVRKSEKLSQTKFAERLETNIEEVKNIELGRLKEPNRKKPFLKLICYEFNISREWLFFGEGSMKDENTPFEKYLKNEKNATENGVRLVQVLLDKDPDEREDFYEFCIELFEAIAKR